MKLLGDFLGWLIWTPVVIVGVILAFGAVLFAMLGWGFILIQGWPWWTWLIWWACVAGILTIVNYTPKETYYIEDLY